MVYIYVPVFWGAFFTIFGIAIGGGGFITDEGSASSLHKLGVFFEQIIVTSTQFEQNSGFFVQN